MSKSKDSLPVPVLKEFPNNEILRWQWHSPIPWIDERYGKTGYIAGFSDRKRALDYGIMCGWV